MEASWFKSDHSSGLTGELPIVIFCSFGRANVTDGLQQSVMVNHDALISVANSNDSLAFHGARR